MHLLIFFLFLFFPFLSFFFSFFYGPTLLYIEIINLQTVLILSHIETAVHPFKESLCTDILLN